jgi:tRNA (cmo5U34)-methyltransferase
VRHALYELSRGELLNHAQVTAVGLHESRTSFVLQRIDVELGLVTGDFKEKLSRQGVAVGVQPGRWQSNEYITGLNLCAGDELFAINHADDESGQIVLSVGIEAGHLRCFAADQRAAIRAAGVCQAADNLLRYFAIQLPRSEVIQKKEGGCTLDSDVIHAVIHKVCADRVMNPQLKGELELSSHSVSAGDQDWLLVFGRIQLEQAAKAADFTQNILREGALGKIFNALLGAVAARDINAGIGIRDGGWFFLSFRQGKVSTTWNEGLDSGQKPKFSTLQPALRPRLWRITIQSRGVFVMPTSAQRVQSVFDRTSATYDAARARLIPPYEHFYRVAVELLPFEASASPQILDLGAGTGLLSAFIRDRFSTAHLHLVDIATTMLEQARVRLGSENIEYALSDYGVEPITGGWDAIVSALSIHHLSDDAKRDLFHRAYSALNPGGVFVNAEQVAGPTPELTARYHQRWLRDVRERGASDREIADAEYRMREDRCSSVENQLQWLREAGFQDVDCWFKDGLFAVISGGRT